MIECDEDGGRNGDDMIKAKHYRNDKQVEQRYSNNYHIHTM